MKSRVDCLKSVREEEPGYLLCWRGTPGSSYVIYFVVSYSEICLKKAIEIDLRTFYYFLLVFLLLKFGTKNNSFFCCSLARSKKSFENYNVFLFVIIKLAFSFCKRNPELELGRAGGKKWFGIRLS